LHFFLIFGFALLLSYKHVLSYCIIYTHHCIYSFARDAFVTTVNVKGQVSVFRDREVIHSKVQLLMEQVTGAVGAYVDGEPCIAVAGDGVYLLHAVTLGQVRSLPYDGDVTCVCINDTGTKLFFGAEFG
jgi:hypothetical protein